MYLRFIIIYFLNERLNILKNWGGGVFLRILNKIGKVVELNGYI